MLTFHRVTEFRLTLLFVTKYCIFEKMTPQFT